MLVGIVFFPAEVVKWFTTLMADAADLSSSSSLERSYHIGGIILGVYIKVWIA